MTNQTMIITGASRGLGAATARAAAEMGAKVVINARSEDDLVTLVQEIKDAGGQAAAVPGDVSQVEICRRLVAEAIKRFDRLDAVINNAGVIQPIAPIADADLQDWGRNIDVNVLAPVYLVQASLAHLRKSEGRVINVSSGAAVNTIPGWGAYCTAKAAINHFTRLLAAEEPEITAISFRPGVVDTAMQAVIRRHGEQGMPPDEHARFVNYHHEGALLPPEVPARSLAVLALHAPKAWSGDFIQWDEDRVQSLVGSHSV
jgi:NAD(P)-dependent dehydrogenase (short-subunit alcohol dehydrogenase family)